MAFNVNSFRTALVAGGTRPNQFDLIVPFPAGTNNATVDMTMMCHAASLPGEDVGVIDVAYFGRMIKVPGDRVFPEWTVTIYNDEDFQIRDAFEQWSGFINTHVANLRAANYLPWQTYSQNITVHQYGKVGGIIKTYTMTGAWPSNVSAIQTAWDNVNTIESFDVTFAFQWWNANTTD
jgi:hypothetical protein